MNLMGVGMVMGSWVSGQACQNVRVVPLNLMIAGMMVTGKYRGFASSLAYVRHRMNLMKAGMMMWRAGSRAGYTTGRAESSSQ